MLRATRTPSAHHTRLAAAAMIRRDIAPCHGHCRATYFHTASAQTAPAYRPKARLRAFQESIAPIMTAFQAFLYAHGLRRPDYAAAQRADMSRAGAPPCAASGRRSLFRPRTFRRRRHAILVINGPRRRITTAQNIMMMGNDAMANLIILEEAAG